MKSTSVITLILFSLFLISYKSISAKTYKQEGETEYNSPLFDRIIFSNGGEFLGLTLGETKESVLAKLPQEAFEYEQEGFFYYSWKIDNNNYYLDLYFNEDNTLFSIAGYIYLNTVEGEFDNEGADNLFADLKPYFVKKFGTPTFEEDDYIAFELEANIVDLGKGDGEVYFYVAQIFVEHEFFNLENLDNENLDHDFLNIDFLDEEEEFNFDGKIVEED